MPDQRRDPEFLGSVYSSPDAYASARFVTLGDGVERGVRVVEFRTAGGLDADITIDRGGDIGRLALNGKTLSWHAPHGLRAPWLLDSANDGGRGFLRGFNGFLNTCGLDHIRQPERDTLDDATVSPSNEADYPLHGTSTFDPTRLIGYGLNDDTAEPYLWCEVERIESMSMRGALRLRRKFRAPIWGSSISIRDEVVNVGHSSVSHMMLYHFNIGYPLVAPGTRLSIESGTEIWKSRPHDPISSFPEPLELRANDISVFKLDGSTAKAVITSDCCGCGMEFKFDTATLPYLQLLRMTSPGLYGIGLEPCTTRAMSRREARDIDEMVVLKRGGRREYAVDIKLFEHDSSER
ncbi:DUF4432 family protein [Pararhizobium sp. IMCC21322]|uniref:DUF4432 family protein n=1 Tax=Pararhizobium sp. IMCC21322 TaxID=3067903 RepID=UPI002740B52D|nr:DUF4432 family protein [Pararhizobium sp. IMCC21322]